MVTPWEIASAAFVEGVIMAGVLRALAVTFWQQLVIASVSAILTGVFVVGAAFIAARAAAQTRGKMEDLKRGLGLDRRAGDKPGAGGGSAGDGS